MLNWAWQASGQADGWKLKARFLANAVRHRKLSRELARLTPDTPLGALMAEWPQTAAMMIWPYQCADWDAAERFERIRGHLSAVAGIPGLQLKPEDKLLLADLSAYSERAMLVLDRPPWLAKEGHLTLSLFKGEFRAFSVSFSLLRREGLELFIGGIQGRQDDKALELYRALTKELHGVRPRDFTLEALRMFAQILGVDRIYAVADDHKISKHPFFRKGGIGTAYDPLWEERGGIRIADTHWELPVAPSRRDLDQVPSKKRSMYRQRYAMFDAIIAALPSDLTKAERRHFEAT